jgi:hypothetical protein
MYDWWPRLWRIDLFADCRRRAEADRALDEDLAQGRPRIRQRRTSRTFLEVTRERGAAGRIEFAVIPRIEKVSGFVAVHAVRPIRCAVSFYDKSSRSRRTMTARSKTILPR